jgi:thiamine biosynthesis lipoprotein
MYKRSYDALGTHFDITLWDEVPLERFSASADRCEAITREFDATYSRFKPDSLVTRLSREIGTHEVPHDLIAMLRLYEKLSDATGGKITPTIGFALSDSGYDANYSLRAQSTLRDVPPLREALTIGDDTHLSLHEKVLLDLGALGKGYVVDLLYDALYSEGYERFLVDGSGDVRFHSGGGGPIVCGLEHPLDSTLAIGTFPLRDGAFCASATNRRRWGERHHYLDPSSKNSPQEIVATWVAAEDAALADGLSSALFFVAPETLQQFPFECLVVNRDLKMKRSAGFAAELFQ